LLCIPWFASLLSCSLLSFCFDRGSVHCCSLFWKKPCWGRV